MTIRQFVLFLLALLSPAFLAGARGTARAAPQEWKNVLVVLPFTQDFPAHRAFIEGLKEGYPQRAGEGVRFTYEFLDLGRFQEEDGYLRRVAAFFRDKYSVRQPDMVVTGATLEEFMLRHGDVMFPGVPIVFGTFRSEGAPGTLPPGRYMFSGHIDYARDLEVILSTRPSARKILVVLGASSEERLLKENILADAVPYAGRLELVFLDGLSYSGMLEAVRSAGDGTAIMFIRWLKDSEGRGFIPAQVLRTVSREAKVPVYGTASHLIGEGGVGGYLYSHRMLGKTIAEKSWDILSGKTVSQQLFRSEANEYVFDWRQLKRWSIPESSLPPGSRVLFRPPSAWEEHRQMILAGLAVMLLEAVLVGALVVNRARRTRVEKELKRVNESLEEEVVRRTREINQANTELIRAKDLLEDMNASLDLASRTDSLTGLYNRRHLEDVFEREQARSSRTGDPYSVIMCDIDHFKDVNDQCGHLAGDELLGQLAGELRQAVRPYDTLARWGGEEFLLLLPGTGASQALAIAERIRVDVSGRAFSCAGFSLRVTMTLGVAAMNPGETVDQVLKRADDCLYEGKRTGRDRVVSA